MRRFAVLSADARRSDAGLAPDAGLEEALSQLHRTSEWLRTMPLARLTSVRSGVAEGARRLVFRVAEVTRQLCDATTACRECAPNRRSPHLVDDAVLGAQLEVLTRQLRRVVVECRPDLAQPGLVEEVRSVAAEALALRRG